MDKTIKCPYCGRVVVPLSYGDIWVVACSFYDCNNPHEIGGDDLNETIEEFLKHTPEYDKNNEQE